MVQWCVQDAPILAVGTSTGAVKVIRMTGPLAQIDDVNHELQGKNLDAAVEANLSLSRAAAK